MSVGGIGGATRFFLHIYDRSRVGAATPREQRTEESAKEAQRDAENRRLARLAEERQQQKIQQFENLDVERLRRERILDPTDGRPVARGSIVDFEV